MKHLRWLPLIVLVLLLMTGSVTVWAYAHRSYPNAVYYSRSTIRWMHSSVTETALTEGWEDLNRGILLIRLASGGQPPLWELLSSHGRTLTTWRSDGRAYVSPLSPQDPLQLRQDTTIVARGVRNQGDMYLARAVGRIERGSLDGRPVLVFNTRPQASGGVSAQSIWLDAATLDLVQDGTTYTDGTIVTEHFLRHLQRLAPGTLPNTFFDPPNTHHSLWDQAIVWVNSHLAGHQ